MLPLVLRPGALLVASGWTLAFLRLALHRLRAQATLAGLLGLGLLAVSAVAASVPLLTDAILTLQLRQTLAAATGPSPATVLLRWRAPLGDFPPTAEVQRTDQFLTTLVPELLRVPLRSPVRLAQTGRLALLTASDGSPRPTGEYGFFLWLSDLAARADLLEGRWPESGPDLEAVMLTQGIDRLGVAIGQMVWVERPGSSPLAVRIVGRWHPRDPTDPAWVVSPQTYALALVVPAETFHTHLPRLLPRASPEFVWGFALDPQALRADDAGPLLGALADLRRQAQRHRPGLVLERAPEAALAAAQRQAQWLFVLLGAVSLPLLLTSGLFLSAAARLLVEEQRAEIAVLKSRGASTLQIVVLFWLATLPLAGMAVLAGPALGGLLAAGLGGAGWLVGNAGERVDLPVVPGPAALVGAAIAVGLAWLGLGWPAWEAARTTVVTYRQELARRLRTPLWERALLDLLPLPVAGYGYYLLHQRGALLPADAGRLDPLPLVAPALFIIAGGLVYRRLLPGLWGLAERAGRVVAGPTLLLALRQVSRHPFEYRGIVLMLVVTLALSLFSVSAARTLAESDQVAVDYRVGADLRLGEEGVVNPLTGEWILRPVDDYRAVPGVLAAARVVRASGRLTVEGRATPIQVLAVEPAELVEVVRWRPEYADQPLLDLFSALAASETAALVDRRLAEQLRLRPGDEIALAVGDQALNITVAGVSAYFPTLLPTEGPFIIVNLEQLLGRIGLPGVEIWLRLAPAVDDAAVLTALAQQGLAVSPLASRMALLAARQRDPGRLGVFGLLGLGLSVGVGLGLLGWSTASYLAFRRRLVQIGVLRALGLSSGQVGWLLVSEEIGVIVSSLGPGLLLGLLTAGLYGPRLLGEPPAGPPPQPVLAWAEAGSLTGLLALGLLGTLPVTLGLLRRVRIHEALKLGEAV